MGLARAYVRAKHDLSIGQWIGRGFERALVVLRLKLRDVTIHVGAARGAIRFEARASGHVEHHVDISLSLHEQISRLADFVNTRAREAARMSTKIADVERELDRVRHETSELERRTLAHMESQIQQLNDRLDGIQVLDLTWAIWGLFLSAVGTVLSFGT
jgi:hypothetical protein